VPRFDVRHGNAVGGVPYRVRNWVVEFEANRLILVKKLLTAFRWRLRAAAASAVLSSAWRRTGALADGSRHVWVCSGRLTGEQGDECVGGLAEII
jgi:hypothetical protein